MKIVTPDQNKAAQPSVKLCVVGVPGVGKTWLAGELADAGRKVLFLDMEAGTLSIAGKSLWIAKVEAWRDLETVAAIAGGADPQASGSSAFTPEAAGRARAENADLAKLVDDADVIFVDSFTYASALAYADVMANPPLSRNGNVDLWAVYRGVADRMLSVLRAFQRAPVDVVMTAILELRPDQAPAIQVRGATAERELPAIFDEIVTLARFARHTGEDGSQQVVCYELCGNAVPPGVEFKRAFVCDNGNPFRLPAKDRSGRLSAFEKASIVHLLDKAKGGAQSEKK